MTVETKEFAVVTFVDGSRAFFEKREMADAVNGWYDKAQKFNAIQRAMGNPVADDASKPAKPEGRKFKPKPCPACGCEFVPRSAAQRVCDACKAAGRKAPKATVTWKGQKPGGTSEPEKPKEQPVKKDLNCIEAGCFFCDGGSCSKLGNMVDCEKQLVKNCRRFAKTGSAKKAKPVSPALAEVRKAAMAANIPCGGDGEIHGC